MTIEYHYEDKFRLEDEAEYSDWINRVILSENRLQGPLNFVFCDDAYLLRLNLEYLDHDTLTDVITFDYSDLKAISGDVFISIQRVRENAEKFKVGEDAELKRVMVHGVLHLLGYGDKDEESRIEMRDKEDEKMKMFHVEH